MSISQNGKESYSLLFNAGIYIKYIISNNSKVSRQIQTAQELPFLNFVQNVGAINSVDIFIIDIQNSGLLDKSIDCIYNIIECAFKYNKKIIVLDRPNPLGSLSEGPILKYGMSFRHALTIGEVAKYLNAYFFNNEVDIQVVPMSSYLKSDKFTDLVGYKGQSLKKAQTYLCKSLGKILYKVEPIYVGVNSSKPYQCLMLPKSVTLDQSKWQELKKILNTRFGITSLYCSYFDKVDNIYYTGLLLDINNQEFSIINSLFSIVNFFRSHGILLQSKNLESYFEKIVRGVDKNKINNKNKIKLVNYVNKCKSILIYNPELTPILIN
jgi:uncharacterized protein YbbC (DUF1343 family)